MTDVMLFTAPGCQPCATLKPALEALHSQGRIRLHVIDATKRSDLVAQYNVCCVPTVIAFGVGKVIYHHQGGGNVWQVCRELDAAIRGEGIQ